MASLVCRWSTRFDPLRFLFRARGVSPVVRAYLSVWRLPSAPVLLVAGFAGRLPSAMVPLALLLMVQQQTGSYAVAGLASAVHGVAMAAMAPVLGRLGRPAHSTPGPAGPGRGLPAAADPARRGRPGRRP